MRGGGGRTSWNSEDGLDAELLEAGEEVVSDFDWGHGWRRLEILGTLWIDEGGQRSFERDLKRKATK